MCEATISIGHNRKYISFFTVLVAVLVAVAVTVAPSGGGGTWGPVVGARGSNLPDLREDPPVASNNLNLGLPLLL